MNASVQIERYCQTVPADVAKQAARLHMDEIPEGFLTSLGQRFLERLYRNIPASDSAFLIAARREGEIVGFICGSSNTRRTYLDFALRAGPMAALGIATKLISLRRIRRLFETLIYPTREFTASLPDAEILNFCVARTAQGMGIGRLLFAVLKEEFKQRNVDKIRIVTGESQRRAQSFYDHQGAHRVSELEVHAGISSIVYTYDIQ